MGRVVMAAMLLCACGREAPTPEYYVDGIGVAFQGEKPPWAEQIPQSLPRVVAVAETWFWGEVPAGTTIVFMDEGVVTCDGQPSGGCTSDVGTSHPVVWVPTLLFTGEPYGCLEATPLFHELGHAIGHRGHGEVFHPGREDFLGLAEAVLDGASCSSFRL